MTLVKVGTFSTRKYFSQELYNMNSESKQMTLVKVGTSSPRKYFCQELYSMKSESE